MKNRYRSCHSSLPDIFRQNKRGGPVPHASSAPVVISQWSQSHSVVVATAALYFRQNNRGGPPPHARSAPVVVSQWSQSHSVVVATAALH